MFGPGDEVVCLVTKSRDFPGLGRITIIKGETYTILEIIREGDRKANGWVQGEDTVQLVEFGILDGGLLGYGFNPKWFRKVERRNDRLSLTEWLAQPTDVEEPNLARAKKRERVQ